MSSVALTILLDMLSKSEGEIMSGALVHPSAYGSLSFSMTQT